MRIKHASGTHFYPKIRPAPYQENSKSFAEKKPAF